MLEQVSITRNENGWIMQMPEEMLAETGAKEGSVIVLSAHEGKLEAEIISPQLPKKPRILRTGLPIRDHSREDAWLEKNRDEYAGKYVALIGDKLVASDANLKTVITEARNSGFPDALITLVERRDAPLYVGDIF